MWQFFDYITMQREYSFLRNFSSQSAIDARKLATLILSQSSRNPLDAEPYLEFAWRNGSTLLQVFRAKQIRIQYIIVAWPYVVFVSLATLDELF